MAKWLIDPGHGGTDPGAILGSRKESSDVLRLALKVGEILKVNGEAVTYTRATDVFVSLNNRCSIENKSNYDYFVSFHRNAPPKNVVALGTETHIYAKGGRAEILATKVNNALVNCGFNNRGVKVTNYQVLRETKCSAILIEAGYITHETDNKIFDEKFTSIANGIAKACLNQVNKELNTELSSNINSTGAIYKVIAGSFKDKGNAIAQSDKIKKLGFENYVWSTDGLYKIVAGTFSIKENAIKRVESLKKLTIDSYIL